MGYRFRVRWPYKERVNHVHAWGLIGVAVALAGILLPIFQAQSADAAGIRWWWPTPWMAVPVLVLAVGLLLLFVPVKRPDKIAITQPPNVQAGSDPPTEDKPLGLSRPPVSGDRVFVDVTPQYLTGFYDDHTTIQGQALADAYIGKWIRLSAPFGDVWPWSGTSSQVTFQRGSFNLYDANGLHLRSTFVYMYCRDRTEADEFGTLQPGTPITVLGQIERVTYGTLHLGNCELAG